MLLCYYVKKLLCYVKKLLCYVILCCVMLCQSYLVMLFSPLYKTHTVFLSRHTDACGYYICI